MQLMGIHAAAVAGDVAGIERALSDGEDVNGRDEGKNTALHWAVTLRPIDALRQLLEAGAEVDALDQDWHTALHDAARYNNSPATRLLLAVGADLNSRNRDKATPVDCARRAGHKNLADYLQSVTDGVTRCPTADEVELDMDKRRDALHALANRGKYARMEAVRQAQREAALERGEGI